MRLKTYAKRVWNIIKNNGISDKKKFLGINLCDKKTPDNYRTTKVDKKKDQLHERLDLVVYIVAFIVLHQ